MTFPLQWYLLFLISIPQTLLITLLGLTIFNLDLSWKKVLFISVISGAFSYLIRLVPMVFGLHTLINLMVLTLLVSRIARVRFVYALCAMVAGVVVLAVIESCILPLFLAYTSITIDSIQAHPGHNLLIFFTEAMVMLVLYFMIKKFNLRMWDLNDVR